MTFREIKSHWCTAIVRIHTMHIFYVDKNAVSEYLTRFKIEKIPFIHRTL
jgi:hypothetical protein